MAGLNAVRQALADTLKRGIPGARTYAYMPDQIAVGPDGAFVVGQDEGDEVAAYYQTMGTAPLVKYTLRIWHYVGRASDRGGQGQLDEYLASDGSRSVRAAVQANRTLDGAAETLALGNPTGYGSYQFGDALYLGATWPVEVWANG